MWWDWSSGWVAGMIAMMAVMFIFGAGIIALIVWLIVRFTRHEASRGGTEGSRPLDIARTRYAKGEITKDEYDRLKKDLSS